MCGDWATSRWPLYLVLLCTITAVSLSRAESHECRCTDPYSSCWPPQQEWDALNDTVGGRLISPKPTGSPCHEPYFNAPVCENIRDNYFNSYIRAENAGSLQWENWEDEGKKNCSMYAPKSSACHQGQVPVLGVQVEEVSDVQKAVKFAAFYNLRVALKTSGHDLLGRSTAAGSFLIWMHKLRNISIHDSYELSGGCKQYESPVIKIVGGVTWGEVYDFLKPTGYITVGGFSLTVSAAGGYVQGGGHSAWGPLFGLAVDSALEFEVVTADGKLRIINACNDADLFFALRGGGGGTFGVVTSIIYKLHRNPSNLIGLVCLFSPPNGTIWTPATQEDILTVWSSGVRALDAARWGGYWTLSTQAFTLVYLAPSTQAVTNETIKSIVEELMQIENVTLSFQTYSHHSSLQEWHKTAQAFVSPKTGTNYVGDRWLVGSRIIPLSALKDPRRVSKNLLAAFAEVGEFTTLSGLMVIGPGVREGDPSGVTSVTPAWRKGIWHMLASASWTWNATEEAKTIVRKKLKAFVKSLQNSYPDSGAYTNEASIDEPHFQHSFWGLSNYARLIVTKQRVDPHGLFVCLQCVGSEFWDHTGNCRRHG